MKSVPRFMSLSHMKMYKKKAGEVLNTVTYRTTYSGREPIFCWEAGIAISNVLNKYYSTLLLKEQASTNDVT